MFFLTETTTLLITGAKPLAISASDIETMKDTGGIIQVKTTVLECDHGQTTLQPFTVLECDHGQTTLQPFWRLLARMQFLLLPAGLCDKHTEEHGR